MAKVMHLVNVLHMEPNGDELRCICRTKAADGGVETAKELSKLKAQGYTICSKMAERTYLATNCRILHLIGDPMPWRDPYETVCGTECEAENKGPPENPLARLETLFLPEQRHYHGARRPREEAMRAVPQR